MELDDKVSSKINSFKRVYLFFTIIYAIYVGVLLFKLSGNYATGKLPQVIIGFVLFYSVYYGLKRKRKWVIPIVLVLPAFGLINYLIATHTPPSKFPSLNIISVVEDFAMGLFCAYQIYFFSRKEVRKVFGVRGQILF